MQSNTRPLRAANGAFHLGHVARAQGLKLCDFCDRHGRDCVRDTEEGCTDLVPALFFIPPHIGLDGKFSTFRASSIWYERARVLMGSHRTIALRETGTMKPLGRARVLNAVRGPFWALMRRHAHTNHLFALDDPPPSPAEASERLQSWIRSKMGSRYVKERDAICTVLYLKKLPT